MDDQLRAVVLVEGVSDQVALGTIAARRGRDLAAEGIGVVPMGGARSIGRYLERYGPGGLGLELAGLCDAGEEREVRLGLERAGLRVGRGRAGLEAAGFYVCVADLEDELIRCLGAASVERIVAAQGELGRSGPCSGSPLSGTGASSSSSTASWARAPAASSATRGCSPRPSTPRRAPAPRPGPRPPLT